jgi:hypothetical protein
MIFWYFCALIWFKNIEKMLLQMASGFLQLESTLPHLLFYRNVRRILIRHFYIIAVHSFCWLPTSQKSIINCLYKLFVIHE